MRDYRRLGNPPRLAQVGHMANGKRGEGTAVLSVATTQRCRAKGDEDIGISNYILRNQRLVESQRRGRGEGRLESSV